MLHFIYITKQLKGKAGSDQYNINIFDNPVFHRVFLLKFHILYTIIYNIIISNNIICNIYIMLYIDQTLVYITLRTLQSMYSNFNNIN